ncbi:MAG: AMP-binding protein [Sporichthyaceae bacterium]
MIDFLSSGRRLWSAAGNAVEVARYGGLDTGEQPSPFTIEARTPMYRLRRYFPGESAGPAIVLIPPLMMSTDVYDVSTATSAVAILHAAGVDPWVVDFGAPEHQEGGRKRTVADHVVAVSSAIDVVRARTGRDVHLAGYSQGGMFAYQVAAYRRSAGIASLITFGSPVDARATRVFDTLSENALADFLAAVADNVLVHVTVPAWASRFGFRLLDPVKSVRSRVDFVRKLHDRDALLPRERQRQFLDNDGYVAYPGPAVADLVKQFVAHNRMLSGGLMVDGQMSTLADIEAPVLAFVGEVDSIAPAPAVRALVRAAPAAQCWECLVPTGHFGMVVGSGAARRTWPTVAEWIHWRGGTGPQPADVHELVETDEQGAGWSALGAGLEQTAATVSAARGVANTVVGSVLGAAAIGRDLVHALPGLTRQERVRPDSRVSVGALLAERAARNPAATFFVFDGRGHSYAAADARVTAVARGLIAMGVRHGDRVGVLMATRPSALSVLVALNRLGAAAALLRPGGDTALEARLAGIERVVVDPEHVEAGRAAGVPILVLGGGATPRPLPEDVSDLERIDPDQVADPAWYRPNPGRASDPAFLLFIGEGAGTRLTRISNGRWIQSAFGTASAARLRPTDTVYSITPLHHASALLTATGGALAGGARLAMAAGLDPETFWAEVRRYGVTVVSYTWTALRELIEAEPTSAERGHPIRLFMGSGMPGWLWRRTLDRFPTTAVLEFFTAGDEGVALANTPGVKIGAKGQPLPGSAEVRVVRYDPVTGRLATGADGLAIECEPDEPGLLVARAGERADEADDLRGLFLAEDRWRSTAHLFRRDLEGDLWLVGHLADLVYTDDGVASPLPAEEALGALDAVGAVAAYGAVEPSGAQRLLAAVTMRPGRGLSAQALTAALASLPPEARPEHVRLVSDIPTTAWWRPRRSTLAATAPAPNETGWRRGPDGVYRAVPEPRRSRRGPTD